MNFFHSNIGDILSKKIRNTYAKNADKAKQRKNALGNLSNGESNPTTA